jgi:hypothetical protein
MDRVEAAGLVSTPGHTASQAEVIPVSDDLWLEMIDSMQNEHENA